MLAWVLGGAGIALASFIKGAIGFGFPTVATPLVALASDVRTAVAVLLLPNLVMDAAQVLRRPGRLAALRRHASLVLAGVLGTVVGTQFLVRVTARALLASLGAVLLAFVLFSLARPAWRLRPGLERPLAPAVGLASGLLGGLTNVFSLPLAPYLYALGLDKGEFVRAISLAFLVFKLAQLGAVWQVGLLDPRVLGLSVLATLGGLGVFRLGLLAQDRVSPERFNQAVLAFLGVASLAMLGRALAAP